MRKKRLTVILLLVVGLLVFPLPLRAAEDPHGLEPAEDMVFFPKLAGLRNKTFKNQHGNSKHLSEAIVLRKSEIADAKAQVPAGGLFYISEIGGHAEPFARDPFLVLGEHTYLVDLTSGKHVIDGLSVKTRQKVPVGNTGYRMWFDYSTDHYEKPYAELALISPSGGWPLEFPIATVFPGREQILDVNVGEGFVEQIKGFYLDNEYLYGASRFVAEEVGFNKVAFDTIEFPKISEAVFSMHRPIVLDVRQEDYRFYFDKRIYAFRRPDGFFRSCHQFLREQGVGRKTGQARNRSGIQKPGGGEGQISSDHTRAGYPDRNHGPPVFVQAFGLRPLVLGQNPRLSERYAAVCGLP